jgi:arsenate reductase (glutaredoxin)
MINLYGIRNCDNCRKARRWLQDQDIDFHFVDIRDEVLNESQLINWQQQLGWELLLNKKSITWRKIPSFDRDDLNETSARTLMLNYPTVMKRPLLDTGNNVVLGFNVDDYEALKL